MKRCSECRRDYYDDSLLYCLDDGKLLLEGPSILGDGAIDLNSVARSEAPTIVAALDPQFHRGVVSPIGDPLSEITNSIAVLPFTNMSADAENEYFCDGLAEELLNALSKIDDLKVAARTSAFSFKGTKTSIGTIGRLLGVQKVLEGSVRKAGERVRVTVKLINTADGYQQWSEVFDRELTDIFAIQDEITLAVIESLKLNVYGEKRKSIVKRYTNNAEAYQLYLMGRFQFNKFDVSGCIRAIEYFEQTLAIEPDYAPAYAGIAEACGIQWYVGGYGSHELVERQRQSAARAIELDPALAESYRSRALLRCYVDWDFAGADSDYQKAVELNPNDVLAYAWYSLLLAAMGEKEKAIASAKKVRTLDPLSVSGALMAGWAMWFAGDFENSLATANAALELEPASFECLRLQGSALFGLGDKAGAEAALKRSIELGPRPLAYAALCVVQTHMGDLKSAREILDTLLSLYEKDLSPAVCVAYCYICLGEIDNGFEWLKKACDRREGEMIFVRAWPSWLNPLSGDERYAELVHRIGMPDR